ncbi:uncharacterized protein LOC116006000 [Ipomoea triloba]|uniref:uncharacterized protein LOC116006000 n=1 Tax=Ipomoea triloba TaxID=35885 RepID=UPI00125CF61A|nr:uncharacterized protein LOC116006000 [Ipomoea triloba]
MFGAVQLGVLAACVVLFVPLVMAGWHLSRNKMLFFSCALFITLSVGVHLAPYFPAISSFLSSPGLQSSSSLSSYSNPDSCISLLHQVAFSSNSSDLYDKSWEWKWVHSEPLDQCEFQKLGKSDASDLLNGSWVVVAGDSEARFVAVSLLELLLWPYEIELIRADLFKRHSDYSTVVGKIGMKLDFRWAPYVSNLTSLMLEFKERNNYPDVLVMGSGLWDMLHVNDASDYGVSLKLLRDSLVMSLPVYLDSVSDDKPRTGMVSARSPQLFWLGMPMLINSMLNTNAKRERMTDAHWQAYNDELYRSKLLLQFGGPFFLLDFHTLTHNCGAECTTDGMHYNGIVYEAAVQIMLNGLLIESNQKL